MAANPVGALDWDLVRGQLNSIGDGWKQARFDSLPYLVEIITSSDIEASVERLRESRDAIEEIVDGVVGVYHNGFRKAMHHYSQEDLAEARKLLGARHKQLQQQWLRSITLRTSSV